MLSNTNFVIYDTEILHFPKNYKRQFVLIQKLVVWLFMHAMQMFGCYESWIDSHIEDHNNIVGFGKLDKQIEEFRGQIIVLCGFW